MQHRVIEELQCLGTLAAWTGVLDDNYIVIMSVQLFRALLQIQNKIGGNRELPFFQFLKAAIDRIGIPVNKKDPQGAGPVRSTVLGTDSSQVVSRSVLYQSCHL